MTRFLPWLGIGASKFYDWKDRFGKVNEHNAWVPRDHWLTEAAEGRDDPQCADFHALRHSYLSLGGRSGIDLRTLQELAGHSQPELKARYSPSPLLRPGGGRGQAADAGADASAIVGSRSPSRDWDRFGCSTGCIDGRHSAASSGTDPHFH
jgi:hypothetical protein